MKNVILGLILVLAVSLGVLSGCSKPSNTGGGTTTNGPSPVAVANLINSGTSLTTHLGLEQWAKKNPESAKITAGEIQNIVGDLIIPYIDNNQGLSSAAINTILKDKLINAPKLPADIRNAIAVAAAVLDSYVQVPSASSYLSADELAYVKSFLNGLNTGAGDYLNGVSVSSTKSLEKDLRKSGWGK